MKIEVFNEGTKTSREVEIEDGMWVARASVISGFHSDQSECFVHVEDRPLVVEKGRWVQLVAERGSLIQPYLHSTMRDVRPGLWDMVQEQQWLVSDKPFAVVSNEYSSSKSKRRSWTAKLVQSARQVHEGKLGMKIPIEPPIDSYQSKMRDPDNMSEDLRGLRLVSLLDLLNRIGLHFFDANEFLWFWAMISSSSVYYNNVPVFIARDPWQVRSSSHLGWFRYCQKHPIDVGQRPEEEFFFGSEDFFRMWLGQKDILIEHLYVPESFALNVLRLSMFGWKPDGVRIPGWPELRAKDPV